MTYLVLGEISVEPLVAAVLISPQVAESLGSDRMGVICAPMYSHIFALDLKKIWW